MGREQANFGTVERAALAQQIVNRILRMITERQLRPGDRLPAERELAVSMGVGRPALREALRALAMMNVIEIRQGAGAYVTDLEVGQLVQHLEFVFSLNDSTILDLFDARKIVEVGIAELAAQRITPEDIVELQACLERSIATSSDAEAFMYADIELHSLIARIANNPILLRFMELIHQLGLVSRRRTSHLDGVVSQSTADHRLLVEALCSRDPLAARTAMLAHLANVEKRLRQVTSEDE